MIVTITELGARGDGVATVGDERVFVPFALPGERLEVSVNQGRGTIVSLLDRSADRVDPACPLFGQCGGCSLQHIAATPYGEFKRQLVVTALRGVGIEADVDATIDARGEGRRRVTLHADGTQAGYMRAHSHDLIDVASCPILAPALRKRAPNIAREIGRIVGDCDVQVTATETGLDVGVRARRRIRAGALAPLAERLSVARLTLNGETLVQTRAPAVRMGRAVVTLPVDSFLQATGAAEVALAALVAEAVGGAKSVADLFCGAGPFALRLAETARIVAWDSDRRAIAALDAAARHTSGLKPLTARARDLFRDPLAPEELVGVEAVVLDPPRAGAEAQVRELARSKVRTVISVSCDPRTFARDASILVAAGYRLERVTPVDQFAYAAHVEIVGTFRK